MKSYKNKANSETMKRSKKLFLSCVLTVLSLTSAFGQKETPKLPIDSLTGKITYSEVIFVDSLANKQELFSRAREWFAKAYKSSTNVIQMEDKESGKIVGKAVTEVFHKALGSMYSDGYINYTISIYTKDGRYKYEITDFYHNDYGTCEKMLNTTEKVMGVSYQKTFNYYLFQVDNSMKSLISDLKSFMVEKAKTTKKEEW